MEQSMEVLPVSYTDIESAAQRLRGVAHQTPVLTSRTVNALTGATVFFKAEQLQRVGAFKFRGAYNALAQWTAEQREGGVLAFSSGNHAQAVALAGALLDIPATILMPRDAVPAKLAATRGYGAEVITFDPAGPRREELARRMVEERGLTLLPPYDHPGIVAGQGTVARELFEETGPLDALLVPCGGGGLLAGSAVTAAALSPGCAVIGVEPAAGNDGLRSFRSGTLQTAENPDTVADGACTPSLGAQVTFPIIRRFVTDMVTVSDPELLRAMFLLWERLKAVVEPTGALAAAALLSGRVRLSGQRVGIILSGGNVDLRQVARYLTIAAP
jgi:threo-3-hydroxy-L-aspartate ammonia-lyase